MKTEPTDVELSKHECLRNMFPQSSLAVNLSWMDFKAPNSKFQTEGAAYVKRICSPKVDLSRFEKPCDPPVPNSRKDAVCQSLLPVVLPVTVSVVSATVHYCSACHRHPL